MSVRIELVGVWAEFVDVRIERVGVWAEFAGVSIRSACGRLGSSRRTLSLPFSGDDKDLYLRAEHTLSSWGGGAVAISEQIGISLLRKGRSASYFPLKAGDELVYHSLEQNGELLRHTGASGSARDDRWHELCLIIVYQPQEPDPMKKTTKPFSRSGLTFGDLVFAVSSVSRTSNEVAAAVSDLLESGKVRLTNNGRTIRARVA